MGRPGKIFSEEDDLFIIFNIEKLGIMELTRIFGCSFETLHKRLDFLQICKPEYNAGHFFLDNDCYMNVYSKVYPEKYMVVDASDYDKMKKLTWNIKTSSDGIYYAVSRDKGVIIQAGRYLLDYDGPLKIDHIDGDGLNNRRSNLRIATHNQNLMNAKVYKGSTSKYKGVQYWKNTAKPWKVCIRRKFVKSFDNELDAARFYDEIAKKEYGEFARLNFPDGK